MANKIIYFFSFIKFSHTIFAMPFALLGYFLAVKFYEYHFDLMTLVYILLCMIFARNSAMGFNRYIDRKIDLLNPRTKNREIPSQKISLNAAIIFIIINSLLFILTTYFINSLCFSLSPIALFVIFFYSYTKRFTSLAHIVLGLALSIAPVGAFIAVTGEFKTPVIILSLLVLFWTAGFDILYSLQDEDFDKKNKLFSIPARFGKNKSILISRLLHLLSGIFGIIFGLLISANILFWIGLFSFCSLLFLQHYVLQKKGLGKINFVFANMNGIASILFSIFTIMSWVFPIVL